MAQEDVAGLAARGRSARSGSRPPSPPRAARVVRESNAHRSLDDDVDAAAPRPPRARAPRGSCRRPRSRSRGGRRRGARAGSSRPAARYTPPGRRPGNASTLLQRADADDAPVGSGPGDAVRNLIASGCEKRGNHEFVRNLHAERLAQRDLDQIDADGVPREVRHLAARNPRRDLDHAASPSSETISCGNAIPSRSPSAWIARVASPPPRSSVSP